MKRRSTRIATATAGVLLVALLSVAGASAKAPGPTINVPCAGQQALVDAIDAANSAGGGTLNLAPGCDYQLTAADNGENGLPVIATPITMNGRGATIDGTDSVRVLEVDGPGGSLTANAVTITGGSAQDFGGGIANLGGTVTLNSSQVTGNSAVAAGGGIASATFDPSSVASLTLNHSSVSDNQQTLDGNDGGLGGGGIVNIDGTAVLNHSQANGNDAEGFVGGGIANGDYFGSGGQTVLTVNQSQVNDNTAPTAGGGGIQNLLGSVTVNGSQVNGNTSLNGGGISSGNGNGGAPPGTAQLMLNNSQVNGNTATAGPPPPGTGPPIAAGGIANGSDAVLNNTQVDDNTASQTSGGGIVNHGDMTLNNSEVNGNDAAGTGPTASGGGIINAVGQPGAVDTGILTLNHSVVNGNSAGGNGGGIANGVGGMLVGGAVTLRNSQVTGNSAAHGGGIFNNGGTVSLSNSTVAGNTPDNCEPTNSIAGCTG